MIKHVDIIVGLAWGDEGKGKISSAMAKDYDMVAAGMVDQMQDTLFI